MKRSKLSLAILLAFPALAMAKTPVSLDEIKVVALRDSTVLCSSCTKSKIQS